MNTNDKVKVFTKIGKMRQEKWIVGTLLESFPESGFLVGSHGNNIWVDKSNSHTIKKFNRSNKEMVVEFENNSWEKLKQLISEGMNKFFPDVKLVIDEKEKCISALNDGVTISSGITEVESIACFSELPTWEVNVWRTIPATRWEPEDVDCKLAGDGTSAFAAAKVFLDVVWRETMDDYWCQFDPIYDPPND